MMRVFHVHIMRALNDAGTHRFDRTIVSVVGLVVVHLRCVVVSGSVVLY